MAKYAVKARKRYRDFLIKIVDDVATKADCFVFLVPNNNEHADKLSTK